MENRFLVVLLILCLAGSPVAASALPAAPAAKTEPPSLWLDLLTDLVQRLFATGSTAEGDEEEPPTADPVRIAPQPTAEPQESNPDGGTEQYPTLDPIG